MSEKRNKFKYLHLHLSIYIPRGGAFDLFATMLKFGTHKRNGGERKVLNDVTKIIIFPSSAVFF